MRKILCKILTLGNHLWGYRPYRSCKNPRGTGPQIRCRICGELPPNQWKIYEKKFKNRKRGKYVTNISNNS